MAERKQINFTVVPDAPGDAPRFYSNFCALSHTPYDFTLTFCEVLPPTESDVRRAETNQQLRAPVRAQIVVPAPFIPHLIAALQNHLHNYSEAPPKVTPPKDAVH